MVWVFNKHKQNNSIRLIDQGFCSRILSSHVLTEDNDISRVFLAFLQQTQTETIGSAGDTVSEIINYNINLLLNISVGSKSMQNSAIRLINRAAAPVSILAGREVARMSAEVDEKEKATAEVKNKVGAENKAGAEAKLKAKTKNKADAELKAKVKANAETQADTTVNGGDTAGKFRTATPGSILEKYAFTGMITANIINRRDPVIIDKKNGIFKSVYTSESAAIPARILRNEQESIIGTGHKSMAGVVSGKIALTGQKHKAVTLPESKDVSVHGKTDTVTFKNRYTADSGDMNTSMPDGINTAVSESTDAVVLEDLRTVSESMGMVERTVDGLTERPVAGTVLYGSGDSINWVYLFTPFQAAGGNRTIACSPTYKQPAQAAVSERIWKAILMRLEVFVPPILKLNRIAEYMPVERTSEMELMQQAGRFYKDTGRENIIKNTETIKTGIIKLFENTTSLFGKQTRERGLMYKERRTDSGLADMAWNTGMSGTEELAEHTGEPGYDRINRSTGFSNTAESTNAYRRGQGYIPVTPVRMEYWSGSGVFEQLLKSKTAADASIFLLGSKAANARISATLNKNTSGTDMITAAADTIRSTSEITGLHGENVLLFESNNPKDGNGAALSAEIHNSDLMHTAHLFPGSLALKTLKLYSLIFRPFACKSSLIGNFVKQNVAQSGLVAPEILLKGREALGSSYADMESTVPNDTHAAAQLLLENGGQSVSHRAYENYSKKLPVIGKLVYNNNRYVNTETQNQRQDGFINLRQMVQKAATASNADAAAKANADAKAAAAFKISTASETNAVLKAIATANATSGLKVTAASGMDVEAAAKPKINTKAETETVDLKLAMAQSPGGSDMNSAMASRILKTYSGFVLKVMKSLGRPGTNKSRLFSRPVVSAVSSGEVKASAGKSSTDSLREGKTGIELINGYKSDVSASSADILAAVLQRAGMGGRGQANAVVAGRRAENASMTRRGTARAVMTEKGATDFSRGDIAGLDMIYGSEPDAVSSRVDKTAAAVQGFGIYDAVFANAGLTYNSLAGAGFSGFGMLSAGISRMGVPGEGHSRMGVSTARPARTNIAGSDQSGRNSQNTGLAHAGLAALLPLNAANMVRSYNNLVRSVSDYPSNEADIARTSIVYKNNAQSVATGGNVPAERAEQNEMKTKVINETINDNIVPTAADNKNGAVDIEGIANKVYRKLEDRLRLERQRRGLFR